MRRRWDLPPPQAAAGRRGWGHGERRGRAPESAASAASGRLRRGLLGVRAGSVRGAAAAVAGGFGRSCGRQEPAAAGRGSSRGGLVWGTEGAGQLGLCWGLQGGQAEEGGVGAPGLGSPFAGGLVWERLFFGIATGRRVRHLQFLCCNQWQLARVTGILVANAG